MPSLFIVCTVAIYTFTYCARKKLHPGPGLINTTQTVNVFNIIMDFLTIFKCHLRSLKNINFYLKKYCKNNNTIENNPRDYYNKYCNAINI